MQNSLPRMQHPTPAVYDKTVEALHTSECSIAKRHQTVKMYIPLAAIVIADAYVAKGGTILPGDLPWVEEQ